MKNLIVALTLICASAGTAQASMMRLHYDAAAIDATLKALMDVPGTMMSSISSIRVRSVKSVEVELTDGSDVRVLKFQIQETHCGYSGCPLKATLAE